ncbi:aspartate ammonia-lyase [Salmonella enterica subsp. enterica]|uniref:Aspartate ammonia-lyase n=1 Tax=Salmonella enterica I TaxID=59201 RepID=A0A447PW74_SALET|nr:aspartate ammonia-lyase [Salmonella enterica subsp. enterica]
MVHSALKRLAVKMSKICNDLRLLSSGPRAGLNEINLPETAGGLFHHASQSETRLYRKS